MTNERQITENDSSLAYIIYADGGDMCWQLARDTGIPPWTYSPGHISRIVPPPRQFPLLTWCSTFPSLPPPPYTDLQCKAIYR